MHRRTRVRRYKRLRSNDTKRRAVDPTNDVSEPPKPVESFFVPVLPLAPSPQLPGSKSESFIFESGLNGATTTHMAPTSGSTGTKTGPDARAPTPALSATARTPVRLPDAARAGARWSTAHTAPQSTRTRRRRPSTHTDQIAHPRTSRSSRRAGLTTLWAASWIHDGRVLRCARHEGPVLIRPVLRR
jgi:hypothetical protein